MKPLVRADLMGLEVYAERREDFRKGAVAHKRRRMVSLGPSATLFFEDRLTILYQVQEMLRLERIFEPDEIDAELMTYNPLIPDGGDWRATLMLEFDDPQERARRLAELVGIEERVYVRINGFDPVFAVADEDLPRRTPEKTSAVHFLRFPLPPEQIGPLKGGAALALGIDHPTYRGGADPVDPAFRETLLADLD